MDEDGRVPLDVAAHISDQARQLHKLAQEAEMSFLARLLAMVMLQADALRRPKAQK